MASQKINSTQPIHFINPLTVLCLFLVFFTTIKAETDRLKISLDLLQHKLAWVDYREAQEQWKEQAGVGSDSLNFFRQFRRSILADKELFETLQSGRKNLGDDKQKRSFNLIYPLVIRGYLDSKPSIKTIVDSLELFYRSRWCQFESQFKSPVELRSIIMREEQSGRRELAYRTLSSPDETRKDQLPRLIRLRNQEARRLGYNDYFSLIYSQSGKTAEDYEKILKDVENATNDAYHELINRLKGTSNADVEIWDAIYQVNPQRKTIDNLFPADSQINIIKRTFEALGFTLSNLPVYFTLTRGMTENGRAHSIIIDVPGDVRVMVDLKDGRTGFLNLVAAVAEAVRVTKVSETSFLFARMINPAWKEANQTLIQLMVSDEQWLTSMIFASNNQVAQIVQGERDARLLDIRLRLVNAAWELEAYRSRSADLNGLYWDIFEKYMGLTRHEDLSPWVILPKLVTMPFRQVGRLEASMAATQTYAYIKSNFSGRSLSQDVGSYLIYNYYRFGSRYEWHELVERATGNRLTANFLTGK